MTQNKVLIEKCAAIRQQRQHNRKTHGPDYDRVRYINYGGYCTPYEYLKLSNFSLQTLEDVFYQFKKKNVIQYGEVTNRMTITNIPKIAVISRDKIGNSSYLWTGDDSNIIKPIEGETTHIDIITDRACNDTWTSIKQLEMVLVAIYGFVVTLVEPENSNTTWEEVLKKKGPDALVNAQKQALDFSHYWDATIFGDS